MIWKIIAYSFEMMIFIVALVSSVGAFAFVKLRNWCDMGYKHCCAVNAVIAIILYLISDGSDQFILYAWLQILSLQTVADHIFVSHLMGRHVDPEYWNDAITHHVLSYGIIVIYFILLHADENHIFYTIFS